MDNADKKMLEWVRFVATKFRQNVDGWTYSRDTGDLEHIRYRSDHTGYNAPLKRFVDGLKFGFENAFYARKGSLAARLRSDEDRSVWQRILTFFIYFYTRFRKDDNLPPEPKPWDNAQPGEVWHFTANNRRKHEALGWVANDGTWDILTPRGDCVKEVDGQPTLALNRGGYDFDDATGTRLK